MSESAELFAFMRKRSQDKKKHNRESSAQLLKRNKVPFIERNNGAHLIVRDRIDFWPGTGYWRDRKGPIGRGVKNLLKHLETIVESTTV